jgi:hypothetical protein
VRAWRLVLPFVLLLTLCGCEPWFVHPAYEPGDTVFEPALLGTWVGPAPDSGAAADAERFRIEGDGAGAYLVTLGSVEPGKDSLGMPADSALFRAHAFRLDGALLVDLEAVVPPAKYWRGKPPLHRVWRVASLGDTLRWGGLREDWLRAHLRDLGVRIDTLGRHVDDDLVVANATPGLRVLLAGALRDSGAFWACEPKVRRPGTGR